MKPDTPSWNEHIAASYAEFVTTVLRARSIARGAWVTLCRLIESQRIADLLRYWTLDRLALAASSGLVRCDSWGIPNIQRSQGVELEANDLFTVCLERFFDPSKVNLQGTDRSGAVRVIAFIWSYANQGLREVMLKRMASYMDREVPGASACLTILRDVNDRAGKTVETALNEIRHVWSDIGLGSVESDKRKIELISQRILDGSDGTAVGELLDIFRRQPKRASSERYDFEIHTTLARIFTPPFLNAFKQHQGDSVLYGFIVSVLSEGAIDFEFSMIALMTVIQEFGIEGLLLDDRIPDGILAGRGDGPNRHCAADILCELIATAKRGETWGAFAMTALHTSFDEANKRRLRAILESHVMESERLQAVAGVMDGQISLDDLEAALDQ